MKPRNTPLPKPAGHRYWNVDLTAWKTEKIETVEATLDEKRKQLEEVEAALAAEDIDEESVKAAKTEKVQLEAAIEVNSRYLEGLEARDNLGSHHFRMPRYSLGFSLMKMLSTFTEADTFIDNMIETLPLVGAILGVCWNNRTYALDTPAPQSSVEALRAYGEDVIDELQDQYTFEELQALYIVCIPEVQKRLDVTQMAAQRAGFFEAPPQ